MKVDSFCEVLSFQTLLIRNGWAKKQFISKMPGLTIFSYID